MFKEKELYIRKCHNCSGKGYVEQGDFKSQCYYCRGKGYRTAYYGRDKL